MTRHITDRSLLKRDIRRYLPDSSMSFLCTQYSALLNAGLQVTQCTRIISKECADEGMRELMEKVAAGLQSGSSLSEAFRDCAGTRIRPFFYETVRAGENAGDLKESFSALRKYYAKRLKLFSQIRNALIYPAFVVVIAVVVLMVVMLYVMPRLTAVFEGMGGELPFITRLMISISEFVSGHAVLMILIAAAAAAAAMFSRRSEAVRLKRDRRKLKMPFIGRIRTNSLCALFSSTSAMLLESGTVLSKALEITASVMDNTAASNAVMNICRGIRSGESFGACIKREELFPTAFTQMCAVGEETGELQKMLRSCDEYYSDETENSVKKLLSLFEPALLCAVAVIAGFIVFAVYIPLFQMYELF